MTDEIRCIQQVAGTGSFRCLWSPEIRPIGRSVEQPTDITDSADQPVRSRRDRGSTFIELLVAIVLLGTVVVAVLTAVRATIIATTTEREHSRAGQWLQSAEKAIDSAPFGNCSLENGVWRSSNNALLDYNAAVQAVPVPLGWSASQISVQRTTDIDVWDGDSWEPYSTTSACFDDNGLRLQRIRLTVESPDGQIIDILEVVKRG